MLYIQPSSLRKNKYMLSLQKEGKLTAEHCKNITGELGNLKVRKSCHLNILNCNPINSELSRIKQGFFPRVTTYTSQYRQRNCHFYLGNKGSPSYTKKRNLNYYHSCKKIQHFSQIIYVKEKKIHIILYLKLFYSLPKTFCLLFSTISNLYLLFNTALI